MVFTVVIVIVVFEQCRQPFAGTVQSRLNRAFRDTEMFRDSPITPVLCMFKHQNLRIACGKLRQCFTHFLASFRAQKPSERILERRLTRRQGQLRIPLHKPSPTPEFPAVEQRKIDRQPVQPRRNPTRITNRRPLPQRRDCQFLKHLVHPGYLAEPYVNHLAQPDRVMYKFLAPVNRWQFAVAAVNTAAVNTSVITAIFDIRCHTEVIIGVWSEGLWCRRSVSHRRIRSGEGGLEGGRGMETVG